MNNIFPNKERSFPITIICSQFNQDITDRLKTGAFDRLDEYGFKKEDITLIEVPGAFEIPLLAKIIAKRQTEKAIVALGAVIRGETTHYDYVCQQVSNGCQKVSLKFEIPVIFAVLTTENIEQALARSAGLHGHKGRDAIDAAVSMHDALFKIQHD